MWKFLTEHRHNNTIREGATGRALPDCIVSYEGLGLVEFGADDGVALTAERGDGFGYGIFEGAYLGGYGVVAVGVALSQVFKLAAICLIEIVLS